MGTAIQDYHSKATHIDQLQKVSAVVYAVRSNGPDGRRPNSAFKSSLHNLGCRRLNPCSSVISYGCSLSSDTSLSSYVHLHIATLCVSKMPFQAADLCACGQSFWTLHFSKSLRRIRHLQELSQHRESIKQDTEKLQQLKAEIRAKQKAQTTLVRAIKVGLPQSPPKIEQDLDSFVRRNFQYIVHCGTVQGWDDSVHWATSSTSTNFNDCIEPPT